MNYALRITLRALFQIVSKFWDEEWKTAKSANRWAKYVVKICYITHNFAKVIFFEKK